MTTPKHDGGPAFPMVSEIGNLYQQGMSIREYAAIQICAGIAFRRHGFTVEAAAKEAVAQADALLAELEKP